MLTLLVVAVFVGVAFQMSTREERDRAGHFVSIWSQRLILPDSPEGVVFGQALRARTRMVVVTPLIIAANVLVFGMMVVAPGAINLPETLIDWGGSYGPRTTNGEWWRLLAAPFVHAGFLSLAANMLGLLQAARVLERLVGPLAFGSVYLAAGLFSTVISLPVNPLGITAGASGAVCGVYGLLLTTWIRGLFPRSALTIPLDVIKTIALAALTFAVFNYFSGGVPLAGEAFGLLVGVAAGTALVRHVSEHKPPSRRTAVTFATAVLIAMAAAVPVRGIADVRPELRAIVALEQRTAATYDAAVARYRAGRITDAALAAVITQRILPQFGEARKTLQIKGRVRKQDGLAVAEAHTYLRLREESWRLRLAGLNGAGMNKLREAERRERQAIDVIDHFRAA